MSEKISLDSSETYSEVLTHTYYVISCFYVSTKYSK